jgi:hypothetical protein
VRKKARGKGQPMNDAVRERWCELFLEQEEAVENLSRMASVAESCCFATFGQIIAVDNDWEDALFTIRHLVSMIDRFRDDYLSAIRDNVTRLPAPVAGLDNHAIARATANAGGERNDNNVGFWDAIGASETANVLARRVCESSMTKTGAAIHCATLIANTARGP